VLTAYELLYGRDEPPPHRTVLRAGTATTHLLRGDLRTIRVGGIEIVRRLYVAVRNEYWETIAPETENLSVDVQDDSFLVSFDAHHRSREIDFVWHATIAGDHNANITYTMSGRALRDFRYCRIGLCVLFPPSEYAGRPYHGVGSEGLVSGKLPMTIGPQRCEGGVYQPLFPAISNMTVSLRDGVEVRFDLVGDLFEMEDQRNWTDGSFKMYSTPLALGYPHTARADQLFEQRVSITPSGNASESQGTSGAVKLSVGPPLGRLLPPLGLGVASHDVDFSSSDRELLRNLRLDHLRVDIHLDDASFTKRLMRTVRECAILGCGMELALFVTDNADKQLRDFASRLPLSVPVARVLVFHENEETTAPEWVQRARERLSSYLPGVPLGGGTNRYFAELNRAWPKTAGLDAIAYSINPQVHAFDEESLIEALEAQHDTVVSARAGCDGLPIVISPVTLKPRSNPQGVEPQFAEQPEQLPSSVDRRQMTLFAAAWALASIKQLVEGGGAALTYFETTGWRGVKETDHGSPNPKLFPSSPGMVFPVYHVFADIADLKTKPLIECRSSDPLRVQGLVFDSGPGLHVLIANLTSEVQRCTVDFLGNGPVRLRSMDQTTALFAMSRPSQFRSDVGCVEMSVCESTHELNISPYCVVRIDPASADPNKMGDGT
jgi:hypothetical protein